MKKVIATIFGLAVVVLFVWVYFNMVKQPNQDIEPEVDLSSEQLNPWVEVHVPGVQVRRLGAVVTTPLKTGDELFPGDAVITDQSGLVTVHLPDGSVFRLDVETEIVLDDFFFENEKNSLGVKISLTVGRIWNKIISLATPESFWQVETGNAVAAVRGTAFGVEYMPGKSFFVGVENEISVSVVEPDTKEVILNNTTIVGENETLEINDSDIEDFKSNQLILKDQVKPTATGVSERDWIRRAQGQDDTIDNRVDGLRDGGVSDDEVREILKTDDYQEKTAVQERSGATSIQESSNDEADASQVDVSNQGEVQTTNPGEVDTVTNDNPIDTPDDSSVNLLDIPVTNVNSVQPTDTESVQDDPVEPVLEPINTEVLTPVINEPVEIDVNNIQVSAPVSNFSAGTIVY